MKYARIREKTVQLKPVLPHIFCSDTPLTLLFIMHDTATRKKYIRPGIIAVTVKTRIAKKNTFFQDRNSDLMIITHKLSN